MAFLLLGLKVGQVMHDGRMLMLSFSQAQAQSESKDAPKPEEKKDDTAKKDDAAKKPTEGEGSAPPAAQSDDADEPQPPKHEYSQVEVDLLQSLAKRRAELDDWAKQVQLKENMLVATEQRFNTKIDSLQKVKKQVEDLLAQYNEQEDTKIRSLVKIYENMKPKDAARIFEELDMPVLLMVVDRMNERKVSPILAAMSPTKAKDVTVQLAEQRKLQKNKPATPTDASAGGATGATPDASASPATDTGNPAPAGGDSGTPAAATPPATAANPSATGANPPAPAPGR
jgi:flagellar motility protein MotE (MotC chaperone)